MTTTCDCQDSPAPNRAAHPGTRNRLTASTLRPGDPATRRPGAREAGSFIDSVVDALNAFYSEVIQHLKAWTATPPKLREPEGMPDDTPSALVSTALRSQARMQVLKR